LQLFASKIFYFFVFSVCLYSVINAKVFIAKFAAKQIVDTMLSHNGNDPEAKSAHTIAINGSDSILLLLSLQ
jgi:hypothetical protein